MTCKISLLAGSAMALVLPCLVTAPVALAQGAGTSDGGGLQVIDEVVVTAQFRRQNLQETPIAITAVSGEMMDARSQTNVAEIAAQAPSVNLQQGNPTFGPSMAASIRGVGQYDFNPAVEPGVGFYIDDVYYPSLMGAMFDLLDLDRVEVLRGPQGTLAGRNSIGGAIKLYSMQPEGSNTGEVRATYGSRDRLDLRGSVDFNLAPDLDMRVAGVSKRQDGYVKNYDFACMNPSGSAQNPAVGGVTPIKAEGSDCLLGRYGDVNQEAARAQLRYHPDGPLEVNLTADYTHEDRSAPAAVLISADNPATGAIRGDAFNVPYDDRFICGDFCNYATGRAPADPDNGIPFGNTREEHSRYEGYGFSGQVDLDLGGTTQLTSITAYRHYRTDFSNDDDLSPLPVASSWSDLRFRFFSQELRLNGDFADGAVQYTLGGYYSSQKTVFATVLDSRWSGLQFASLGDPVPAHSRAVFGNISWLLTDRLTLNGGLRYTDEDKDYTYSRRNLDGSGGHPVVGGLDGVTGEYSHDRMDYRLNAQYQWTPDVMTYAQFSTGFKGGGLNPRPYFPSQAQPFGPESINAYEVGLKSDLLERRLRLNLAAYYNNYKDIQLVLLSCPQFNPPGVPESVQMPCSMTANGGRAHVKGFEAEFSLQPVAGLMIDGSMSYIDFQYKSINPAAGGPTGVQLDDVAPFSSDWKWSIGAQYTIDMAGGATLTPRVDASYQSEFFTGATNAPSERVPGYAVANARLTWRAAEGDLEISAEVTNLFDKYHYNNIFDLSAGAGYVVGQPGRPREWALTLTKQF